MKAYTDVRAAGNELGEHIGEVVTEQDYNEGGPHAYSHRTKPQATIREARVAAKLWARMNGCTIVEGPENF